MRRVIALWASVVFVTFVSGTVLSGIGTARVGAQDAGVSSGVSSAPPPSTTPGTAATTGGTTTGLATSTPPSTGAASGDASMDAGTYAVRLRDLEQRINALKEQIFASKARLSLLAETVLQGVVAGAQAVIVHENRMSSSYRLVKAVYSLDGARIFSKADEEGSLGDQQQFEVYNGSIVPGEHNVTVNLEYRGNGYGIFSYLKGYKYTVRRSNSFTVPEGKVTTLKVVGFEKGNALTTDPKDRPDLDFRSNVETDKGGAAKKAK